MKNARTQVSRVAYFFGMVWIEAKDGSFYFRRIAEDESVSEIKNGYRKSGEIDGKCELFTTFNGESEKAEVEGNA